MKKYQFSRFVVLIVVGCCGVRCSKVKDVNSTQADKTMQMARGMGMFLTDSATVYSYVMININQSVDNGVDSSFQVAALAAFTDSTTHALFKSMRLAVNGTVINPSASNTYRLGYTDSSGTWPAQGEALAGTNVNISITGATSADTVSQSVYMPKNVLTTTADFPPAGTGGPDNTKSLTLHWVPDPATATQNVIIQVSYYDGLSHSADSALTTHINTLTYVVPDNGSYTISSSDMSAFPTNCYIGIQLGRGTQQAVVLPVSQMRVFFWMINSVSTIPLQVNNL